MVFDMRPRGDVFVWFSGMAGGWLWADAAALDLPDTSGPFATYTAAVMDASTMRRVTDVLEGPPCQNLGMSHAS